MIPARTSHARRVASPLQLGGKAQRFLRFIHEELLPYIDAHYRTQPLRILTSASNGGLCVVYERAIEPVAEFATLLRESAAPALDVHLEVVADYPQVARASYLLGATYQRNGDQARAREMYVRTLEIDPQDASAQLTLEELDQ